MGDPRGMDDPTAEPPPYDQLCNDTFVVYPDMDAGPTKAWMIHHRGEEQVRRLFELGFGKFPAEELYDLRRIRTTSTTGRKIRPTKRRAKNWPSS